MGCDIIFRKEKNGIRKVICEVRNQRFFESLESIKNADSRWSTFLYRDDLDSLDWSIRIDAEPYLRKDYLKVSNKLRTAMAQGYTVTVEISK